MTIREATTKDIDKIYNLGKTVKEFGDSDDVATFWPKHVLSNCIRSKTDWLILAEENNEILGFTIVNNSPVFKKAIIENIFVSPQHRRKGIGKKLLTAAVEKIQTTDCEYICILVEESNKTAINFYINNGFKYGFEKGKSFVWLEKVISDEFVKS